MFTLIQNCEMAQFLQKKLRTMFYDQETIDPIILQKYAKDEIGDRSNVKKAVNYYLTILSDFDILEKEGKKFKWANKKLILSNHILINKLKTKIMDDDIINLIQKDDENYCIKTIEPRMVNLMLSILSDNAFVTRKNIVYNGQELLTETGYAITDIMMGMYW